LPVSTKECAYLRMSLAVADTAGVLDGGTIWN